MMMLWTDDKDDKDDDVERDLVALVPRRRAKGIVGSVLQPVEQIFQVHRFIVSLINENHHPSPCH